MQMAMLMRVALMTWGGIGLYFVQRQELWSFFDKLNERVLAQQSEAILNAQKNLVLLVEDYQKPEGLVAREDPYQSKSHIVFLNSHAKTMLGLMAS
jgi:hypothetical protein